MSSPPSQASPLQAISDKKKKKQSKTGIIYKNDLKLLAMLKLYDQETVKCVPEIQPVLETTAPAPLTLTNPDLNTTSKKKSNSQKEERKLNNRANFKQQLINESLFPRPIDAPKRKRTTRIPQSTRSIEIQMVPENDVENIPTIMMDIAKTISFPLKKENIVNYQRVGHLINFRNKPRGIVVKLYSSSFANSFLAAVQEFNKNNRRNKLNTSHIGLPGHSPIYVHEHLPRATKSLLYATKKKAIEKNLGFVQVVDGEIYVRLNDVSTVIKNLEDLSKLGN